MKLTKKILKYIKNLFFLPVYLERLTRSNDYLHHQINEIGRVAKNDNNLIFKYLSEGIELHPRVKRESDALVTDFRDAHPEARLRYTLASERLKPLSAILDLSCGYGYGTEFLFRKCKLGKTIGGDYFGPAAIYANRVFKQCREDLEFVYVNGLDENAFEANSFDNIVSLETVEHVEEDGKILQNFRKWLKPSGTLLLSVPNEDVIKFDPKTDPFHYRHYNRTTISELATASGFSIIEFIYFDEHGVSEEPRNRIFAVLSPV
jgi:SAM-dependent methyltransferase